MTLRLLCLIPLALSNLSAQDTRKPANSADLRSWLENMVWHHRFTPDEIHSAIGLPAEDIAAALKRFDIRADTRPPRGDDSPLLVLPYPGGRHPRIGFLDGAIDPQRETKISIFTPWDPNSYVVADVPEAIWSNLGLTYLAHTHIPTIWDKEPNKAQLQKLEWKRKPAGELEFERRLPNGIVFGTRVVPHADRVEMTQWLVNGTDKPLSDMRVQNCVMLKGAPEFNQLTNDNKRLENPFVACRSASGKRWIITAWTPCHRPWANPPVPCLHSDPKFPDCPPGERRELHGWLSFYEGTKIDAEFARIRRIWKHSKTTAEPRARQPEANGRE